MCVCACVNYGKLVVVQVLSGVHKKTISQHNISTSQSSSGASNTRCFAPDED